MGADPHARVHIFRHFARAKDATKLYEAVEAKLTELRKFVLWWDGQEKQAGARTPRADRPANPLLISYGIEHHTISRWRSRLKTPDKFAEALEAAQERCTKVCEARKGRSGGFSWLGLLPMA